jgi:hypothetical protein
MGRRERGKTYQLFSKEIMQPVHIHIHVHVHVDKDTEVTVDSPSAASSSSAYPPITASTPSAEAPPEKMPPSESAHGTKIEGPSSESIVDDKGNVWTLEGEQVKLNGANAETSERVVELLYWNKTVYHKNQSDDWWLWDGEWKGMSDPRSHNPPLVIGTQGISPPAGPVTITAQNATIRTGAPASLTGME